MIQSLDRLVHPLIAHRKHKIYVAAIMGYGLGSDHPDEVAFYKKMKEDMKGDELKGYMGINRED